MAVDEDHDAQVWLNFYKYMYIYCIQIKVHFNVTIQYSWWHLCVHNEASTYALSSPQIKQGG